MLLLSLWKSYYKIFKEICMYIKPWNLIYIFAWGGLYENLNNILLIFPYFTMRCQEQPKCYILKKSRFSKKIDFPKTLRKVHIYSLQSILVLVSLSFKQTFLPLHKKWSFPLRISSVTEEILNGKLHFLCSVRIFDA